MHKPWRVLEGREHTFLLGNERKNGHGPFFLSLLSAFRSLRSSRKKKGVWSHLLSNRKAEIQWKMVYPFFSRTFLKLLKHENSIWRIELKEKGREIPSQWCGWFLPGCQPLDSLAIEWDVQGDANKLFHIIQ